MAVFTHLSDEEIQNFLGLYDVGVFQRAEGIPQGIDNTNYKVESSAGRYVLTVFESRISPADIPFFFRFMEHLADCGVPCPLPVSRRDGAKTGILSGKPAALFPFLSGCGLSGIDVTPALCFEFGTLLGHLHIAGLAFPETRKNTMGPESWKSRVAKIGDLADPEILEVVHGELAYAETNWPEGGIPRAAVHLDLFPDNVFVEQARITGIIDFYFAATEFLAYDLAIVVNSWCFDDSCRFVPERWHSLMDGYSRIYKMSDAEKKVFGVFLRAASLRFLVSRLHDLVFYDPLALVTPKDPREYLQKLEFHRHERILPC